MHSLAEKITQFQNFITTALNELNLKQQYQALFDFRARSTPTRHSKSIFIEQAFSLLLSEYELALFQHKEHFWIEQTEFLKKLPDSIKEDEIKELFYKPPSAFSVLSEERIDRLSQSLESISTSALKYYEYPQKLFQKNIDEFIALQSQQKYIDDWLIGKTLSKLGHFSSFSFKTMRLYFRFAQLDEALSADDWYNLITNLDEAARLKLIYFCERLYDNKQFRAYFNEKNNHVNIDYCKQKLISDKVDDLSDFQLIRFIYQNNTTPIEQDEFFEDHFNHFAQNYNTLQINETNESWIVFWKAIYEFQRRFADNKKKQHQIQFTSPQIIYNHFRYQINQKSKEVFYIVILNNKNQILENLKISEGLVNQTLVHPREIFAPVLTLRASKIVLIHNHPSGDPAPSQQDKNITENLCKAAGLLKIEILDHIIFGRKEYFSFQEAGLIEN